MKDKLIDLALMIVGGVAIVVILFWLKTQGYITFL